MGNNNENDIQKIVAEAEEFSDPIEAIVVNSADDSGAAFTPEALVELAALKLRDRAKFEVVRQRIKEHGIRVGELDKLLSQENEEEASQRPKQADILIAIASDAHLFHKPDGTGYADVEINGHRETWLIRSKGFKQWLARRYYLENEGAPNNEAIQTALNVIEAKARFDGPELDVFVRVGSQDGRLYLDLCNDAWQAVEIAPDGWNIIDNPPVRFRRTAGMQSLPEPEKGGSIDKLRPFLNVSSDTDFVLVVSWMIAVLRDEGPYPVLVLAGEQGSAKSTFSAIMRCILDPNTAPLRALPREDRDLFIAANNGHVLTFDNVSGLPAWISDTLCRLATGGGFAVRQLYTDQDEVLFDASRPIVLNGIEDFVTRPDLADRAIFLTLKPIPEDCRKPEKNLWKNIKAERPKILGVLLDAVVRGLKQLPEVHLERSPRMADFAYWATACESAIWPEGTFWHAYNQNRAEAIDVVIEADPVGSAIRVLMIKRGNWSGTASELLDVLSEEVGEAIQKTKTWPSTPRSLSSKVTRVATFLRKVGINIEHHRKGSAGSRIITISSEPDNTVDLPSGSSIASVKTAQIAPLNQEIISTSPSHNTYGEAEIACFDKESDRKNIQKPTEADSTDAGDAGIWASSGSVKAKQ